VCESTFKFGLAFLLDTSSRESNSHDLTEVIDGVGILEYGTYSESGTCPDAS